MSILYHPGKANVVVDALSRLSMDSTSHVEEGKKELAKEVHRLSRLGVRLLDSNKGGVVISKGIGNVADELELPLELAAVHPVFHISILKKCMDDPSLIIPIVNICIKDNLSYEEVLVQILDRQVSKLRTKESASIKVL
ncbi:hypothetical protein MTR67_031829 [Solanum verrucosum]|uniref:Tf2-1-like SH3-like domain-containing protein n=1 Tax=Solanum verrucosum TaxID=315347 RepID=A0AAF0U395_SOLVR|nr:hypothetical protein MTR67_031829 [Solanum verrucosum]